MQWTRWHSPHSVEEQQIEEIGYTDGLGVLDRPRALITNEPLRSVATSTGRRLISSGARALIFTDFGFPAGQVRAVQAQLRIQRFGRIQDRQIQLWLGSAQGQDLSDLAAGNDSVYGGSDGLAWAVDQFDAGRRDFGVIVDLQPHTQYPSADRPIIDQVLLRVSYL